MPSATGASTAAASYSSQRSAYDAGAYQTTAKPVTYASTITVSCECKFSPAMLIFALAFQPKVLV